MKRSTEPQRPRTNGWALNPRRGVRVARPCRIKICYDEADDLSRPVKIRVAAIPTTQVAPRYPQSFTAGSTLTKTRRVLVLELSRASSLPAPDVLEPIDWRICGEQDPEPGSQSNE
jgi:hypothetical protein